ncbi:MAG: hypothetical protein [Bacteriophage sp.]|nr:MAG: hypothetical protein [Bacteriophage sp.]
MDDNGNVLYIERTRLYMFGVFIDIEPNVPFHNALITFVESEFKRFKRYKKLENAYRDVLRDTVIIENEQTYLIALKEYDSRTKDMNDDYMKDANN